MANPATVSAIGIKISAIDDTTRVVAAIQAKLKALEKASPAASAAGMKDVGKQIAALKAELAAVEKLGAGTSSRLANAFKTISTLQTVKDIQQIPGALKAAAAGFGSVRKSAIEAAGAAESVAPALSPLLSIFGGGGLGVIGVAAGLGVVTQNFVDMGTSARRTGEQIGIPVEKLTELQNAGYLAGSSAESVTQSLGGLQDAMADAVYGRDPAKATVFHQLGLDIGNMKAGVRDVTSMLPAFADKFKQIYDTRGAHAAMRMLQIFNVNPDLIGYLKDGAEGLRRYNDEARTHGTLTDEQVEKAKRLQEAERALNLQFREIGIELGTALAPALSQVSREFADWLGQNPAASKAFFDSVGQGALSVAHNIDRLAKAAKLAGEAWLLKRMFGAPGAAAATTDILLGAADPKDRMGSWIDRNIPGAAAFDDFMARHTGFGRTYQEQREADGAPPLGGSDGAPPITSQQTEANRRESWNFWRSKGFTPAGAAAMLAEEGSESGFNPGDVGDGRRALGSFQWHAERRAAIKRATGIDVADPATTHAQQLEAMYAEMRMGLDPQTGQAFAGIRDATSTAAAVYLGVNNVERPGDRAGRAFTDQRAADFYAARYGGGAPAIPPPPPDGTPQPGVAPVAGGGVPDISGYGAGGDPLDGLLRLHVEVEHTNPPPGATVKATSPSPGVTIAPPKVVRQMSDSTMMMP